MVEHSYKTAISPLPVDSIRLEWTDTQRNRKIPVKIHFPKSRDQVCPVIIFSHCLGGSREGYGYLARYWSQYGYVCVHPQHPGSDVSIWQNLPPGHEKDKPSIKLKKIHEQGLFEGTTSEVKTIYAYDLHITENDGNVIQTRDPYSFLPTLGEQDLFLFNQGNELRIFDKLGAQFRTIDGVPGVSFAVWAPNAQRVSVVGDFNHWDGRYHSMSFASMAPRWR